MYSTILYNIDEKGIATASFNRKEFNDTIDWVVAQELEDIMFKASKDPNVRCVVMTSEGDNFATGVDPKRFKQNIEEGKGLGPDGMIYWSRTVHAIRCCDKPVIASIKGAAAGSASALAFAADFRVMEKSSYVLAAYVKLAFCGDSGGYYNLSRIIGNARATEFYMLGEPIYGEEAFKIGLCNRLAEDGKLKEETAALAEKLAASATFAISCQKRMTNRFFYNEILELMDMEREFMQQTSLTEDHAEAVRAMFENRTPVFKGK